MPFDANLVLVDGSADWTFANINTSDYGTPISTTRNAGGFAVIDLGAAWDSKEDMAIVLTLPEAAGAAGDALTLIVEESSSATFASDIHELTKFDILAATKGVIIGSEAPATVVRRVNPRLRYLRVDASVTSGDDFGAGQVNISPYPYKYL